MSSWEIWLPPATLSAITQGKRHLHNSRPAQHNNNNPFPINSCQFCLNIIHESTLILYSTTKSRPSQYRYSHKAPFNITKMSSTPPPNKKRPAPATSPTTGAASAPLSTPFSNSHSASDDAWDRPPYPPAPVASKPKRPSIRARASSRVAQIQVRGHMSRDRDLSLSLAHHCHTMRIQGHTLPG